jgi:hypothetical protein
MKNYLNDPRPTVEEEAAYADVRQRFTEHLQQFASGMAALERLDHAPAPVAQAITAATARTAPGTNPRIQVADGTVWRQAIPLMDNIAVCYRVAEGEMQFAVVERLPSNETYDVLRTGHRPLDVLRDFVRDQKEVLQLWAEDAACQVREYLAEKYPGQDTSRVAEGFMRRFTHGVSAHETLAREQKRPRGIRV